MRYFKKIVGERLYLSPINVDDVEIYTKWLNDYDVSRNISNYVRMISLAGEQKILERMAGDGHNYAMVLLENDTLIGNISLFDIDQLSRRATMGIFIGEAEMRGKGYGAEALRLILEYGFKTLNLHNIDLSVHSDNEAGIACYKKAGFKEYGRRHECKFKDGRYIDVISMEILSTEWEK